MEHRIELTPLQSIAWRAATVVGVTVGDEVTRLREQRDQLTKQIKSLYEEANKVHSDVLEEIAREHGYESIPGDAKTEQQGDRMTFSWEEADEEPVVPDADQADDHGAEIPSDANSSD